MCTLMNDYSEHYIHASDQNWSYIHCTMYIEMDKNPMANDMASDISKVY